MTLIAIKVKNHGKKQMFNSHSLKLTNNISEPFRHPEMTEVKQLFQLIKY